MGRAIVGALVAIAVALLVVVLVGPHLLSSPPSGTVAPVSASPSGSPIPSRNASGELTPASGGPSNPANPDQPGGESSASVTPQPGAIDAPRSAERREYERVEAQRAPFYLWLRENFSVIASVQPAHDDQAVLEIDANTDNPEFPLLLVNQAIAPYGKRNGFEKVRISLQNSPGSVERYRLDTEVTLGRDGVWRPFRKQF